MPKKSLLVERFKKLISHICKGVALGTTPTSKVPRRCLGKKKTKLMTQRETETSTEKVPRSSFGKSKKVPLLQEMMLNSDIILKQKKTKDIWHQSFIKRYQRLLLLHSKVKKRKDYLVFGEHL